MSHCRFEKNIEKNSRLVWVSHTCSNCGYIDWTDVIDARFFNGSYREFSWNYCPCCGNKIINECEEPIDEAYYDPAYICTFDWSLADNGWADHTCSECGYTENLDIHVYLDWNYCPNCGRKIENH